MTPYEIAEIIDKEPLIASLLYDIDLLPEQIKEGDDRRYSYMLAVIGHMQVALAKADQAEEAREAERQLAEANRALLEAAQSATQRSEIPVELYSGHDVYVELGVESYIRPDQVSEVLDAVVRLIRRRRVASTSERKGP